MALEDGDVPCGLSFLHQCLLISGSGQGYAWAIHTGNATSGSRASGVPQTLSQCYRERAVWGAGVGWASWEILGKVRGEFLADRAPGDALGAGPLRG